MLTWKILSGFFIAYYIFSAAKTLLISIYKQNNFLLPKNRAINYIFSNNSYANLFFNIVLIALGIYTIDWQTAFSNIFVILIGLLYLPFMVLFTSPSIKYFILFRYKLIQWIKFIVSHSKLSGIILLQTLEEELIWRCTFVLSMKTFSFYNFEILIIGSILFYIIHFSSNRKLVVLFNEFELLLFSILLYFLFLKMESVFIVWGIHFIRNSFIKFNKYETGILSV